MNDCYDSGTLERVEGAMKLATIAELEAAALQLPIVERVRLVECLLSSLESEETIFTAWVKEAERRAGMLDNGEGRTVAVEDVIAQARARLRA